MIRNSAPRLQLRRGTRPLSRRRARRIVAEHRADLSDRLAGLIGEPVTAFHSDGSSVVIRLPGAVLGLTGVSPAAVGCLSAGGPLALAGGGRYGRYWWLAVTDDGGRRSVLAASRLSLTPTGPGPGNSGQWLPDPADSSQGGELVAAH